MKIVKEVLIKVECDTETNMQEMFLGTSENVLTHEVVSFLEISLMEVNAKLSAYAKRKGMKQEQALELVSTPFCEVEKLIESSDSDNIIKLNKI